MDQTNSSSQPVRSVLQTILDRLAALTPEQYIKPTIPAEDNLHSVGQMTDHMQRVFTLYGEEVNAVNVLRIELRELDMKIMAATQSTGNPMRMLRNLVSGGLSADVVDRRTKLAGEAVLLDMSLKMLSKLFWLEIRTHFGDLDEHNLIRVYDDWSVGWEDETDSLISELIIDLGGGQVPAGFAELLRNRRRQHAEA